MDVKRFALGMRIPAGKVEGPEACISALLRGLDPKELEGLSLWGGECGGVFTLVIMGGGLGRMRRIHAAILENREFAGLLCGELPFIENNRIAKLTDMIEYPMAV